MEISVKLILLVFIGLCVFDVFVTAGPVAGNTKGKKKIAGIGKKLDKLKMMKEPMKYKKELLDLQGGFAGGIGTPTNRGQPTGKGEKANGRYKPQQVGQAIVSKQQRGRGRQGNAPNHETDDWNVLSPAVMNKIKGMGEKLKILKDPTKFKKTRPSPYGGAAGGMEGRKKEGKQKPWHDAEHEQGEQGYQTAESRYGEPMREGQDGQMPPAAQGGYGNRPIKEKHPKVMNKGRRPGNPEKNNGHGRNDHLLKGGKQGHMGKYAEPGFLPIQDGQQYGYHSNVCSCGAETCGDIAPPKPEKGNLVCDFHRDKGCTVCVRLTSADAQPEVSKCCTFPKFAEDLVSDQPNLFGEIPEHIGGHDTSHMKCNVYNEDGTEHGTTVSLFDLGGACPVHPDFYDPKFLAKFFKDKECKVFLRGSDCDQEKAGAKADDAGYNKGGMSKYWPKNN